MEEKDLVLCGEDAERFLEKMKEVEDYPHTQDYTKEAKLVEEYLKSIKL